MKRIVLVLVLFGLFSVTLVTAAFATTSFLVPYIMGASSLNSNHSNIQGTLGTHAAVDSYSVDSQDGIRSDAPGYAQGDCPNHAGASTQGSGPSY